jgi:16S rRNA (cytidine1402-2'-O)-methyltransferase
MKINKFGTLYIVATPIGNSQDITLRAIEILKTVDCIAAEDTRYSVQLLHKFAINTPLLALHQHNEKLATEPLLARLQQGDSIALISDAGTPLISDPGYVLVHEARNCGISVVPIPGACAAIAALSVSGMSAHKFAFEGFLPAKSAARQQALIKLQQEFRTMIFYEAPHRVLACLQDMQIVFGPDRQVVLARELTKMFETVHAATLAELIAWVEKDANQERGEIVLLLAGCEPELSLGDDLLIDKTLQLLLDELPLKKAVMLATKLLGKRKNELYQRALDLSAKK